MNLEFHYVTTCWSSDQPCTDILLVLLERSNIPGQGEWLVYVVTTIVTHLATDLAKICLFGIRHSMALKANDHLSPSKSNRYRIRKQITKNQSISDF